MAAGLGFKTFTTGEVLTAADVNGYLMQGVLVFATEAARNSAITSPQEGQFAFTKDTNSLWYYSGSAWVASGATGDIEGVTAGTGISGGGTSGTVTITNSMATEITAKADLIVGTGNATFDNLPVGANGTVLTADSTVSPTGLKWAAPAGAAGLTLISRSAFSAVTSVSLTGVISASYDAYLISVEKIFYAGSGTRNLLLTLLYSTSTEQTSDYYFNTVKVGSSNTNTSGGPASSWNFCAEISSNTNQASHFLAYLSQVNNQGAPQFSGHGLGGDNFTATLAAGLNTTSRSYTGIKITSSNGSNIAGTVAIYGLGI
jgi:hypothetical protein